MTDPIDLPPSMKTTVPVGAGASGEPLLTVTVNVTSCPYTEVAADELSTVVVARCTGTPTVSPAAPLVLGLKVESP